MKIFDIIRPGKALIRKAEENPAGRRTALTAGEDTIELSTKGTSKFAKLKAEFKELLVGLDKATIQRLEKLPMNDFLAESQKLIAKMDTC